MIETIIGITLFFVAVIIHECAHGWMAYRLGDSTAKNAGRLTLNPLSHIDIIGSVILPLFLVIAHSPVLFGWAKPIPINYYNLRNPREDMFKISLAGPGANFALAFIIAMLLRLSILKDIGGGIDGIFTGLVLINLMLGIFNLIPIPPLDGSRMLTSLLSWENAYKYSRIEPYGVIILFLLLSSGMFHWVIKLTFTLTYYLLGR